MSVSVHYVCLHCFLISVISFIFYQLLYFRLPFKIWLGTTDGSQHLQLPLTYLQQETCLSIICMIDKRALSLSTK